MNKTEIKQSPWMKTGTCEGKTIPIYFKKSLKIPDIRIRKSKKNRQHNDQRKRDKTTNNDLQNILIKQKIE